MEDNNVIVSDQFNSKMLPWEVLFAWSIISHKQYKPYCLLISSPLVISHNFYSQRCIMVEVMLFLRSIRFQIRSINLSRIRWICFKLDQLISTYSTVQKVMRANFNEICALFSLKFLENSANFCLKFCTFDIWNFTEVGENS